VTDGNNWPKKTIFRLAQMVPPIECDLGYRFRTRTLNANPNPNPNRKSNKIYAVQNDTEIKFKIVL